MTQNSTTTALGLAQGSQIQLLAPTDLSEVSDSNQTALVETHKSDEGSRATIRRFLREVFSRKGNTDKPTTSDSASETDGGTPGVLTNGACLGFIEIHSACLGGDGATRATTAVQDAVKEFRALQEARCRRETHDIQQYLSEPYTGSIGGHYDVGRGGRGDQGGDRSNARRLG
jgi:hypothetical protein